MRRGLWLLVLIVLVLAGPLPASFHPDSLIIASRGIGPFQLGMTPTQIQPLRRSAPCEVTPTYTNGRVTRLETNCGGAYRTPEWVQVGIGPGRMFWYYGRPDRITSSDYANVRGEWMHYNGGIAFRVIYGDGPGNALIQAIAVFYGTGRLPVRQEAPPVEPAPLPDVGN